MSITRNHTPGLLALLMVLRSSGTLAATGTGTHPALIEPATTKCVTCHSDVMKGKVRHAPVEPGCLGCHAFGQKGGQTTVKLVKALPELCVTCHAALADSAALKLPASHPPVADCGTCHKVHASDFAHLLKGPGPQICASCHPAEDVNKGHPTPVSRSNCTSCHLPHGGATKGFLSGTVLHAPFKSRSCEACHRKGLGTKARTKTEGAALCYACHAGLEAKLAKGAVHTAVRQGDCTGCHDPHLANQRKLLKAKGNDLCYPCHAGIRGKVSSPGAHAPARSDCLSCHDPHRSDNRSQLVARMPGLCLKCHPPKNRALVKKHLGADLSKVDCAGCHDPHGSKQPSLLADGSVHAPFRERCERCHAGRTTRLAERSARMLCVACHAGVVGNAGAVQSKHAAMKGDCLACHVPHASPRPKLLKAAGGALCTTCHPAQKTKPGDVEHGATALLGCQSCHLAHGGPNPKLLRATGNDLCNGCHLRDVVKRGESGTVTLLGGATLAGVDAASLRLIDLDSTRSKDHPETGHPVSGIARAGGRNPLAQGIVGKEIACISCHAPHSARSKGLFVGGVTSQAQLCLACHPR